jgi:hypothetical protein
MRAFFDDTVRGEWVGEAGKSRLEVTVHVFGQMWP